MSNRKNNAAFVLVGKAQDEAAKAASAIASTARQAGIAAGPPAMQADVVALRHAFEDAFVKGKTSLRDYAISLNVYFGRDDMPWSHINTPWYDVNDSTDAILVKAVNFELHSVRDGIAAKYKDAFGRDYSNPRGIPKRIRDFARDEAKEAEFEAIRTAAVEQDLTPPERPPAEKKTVKSYKVRVADGLRTFYKAGREGHRLNKLDEREEEIYTALQAFMLAIGIDPKLVK